MYEMKLLAHLLLTARQINPGISDVMRQSQGVFFRICTHAQTHIQVYVRLCVTMCVRETVKQRQRAKEIKKRVIQRKRTRERAGGRDGGTERDRERTVRQRRQRENNAGSHTRKSGGGSNLEKKVPHMERLL